MSTKVGLLTTLVTPSPSATPFASCVLPAPSAPMSASTVPGPAAAPMRAADLARLLRARADEGCRRSRRAPSIAPCAASIGRRRSAARRAARWPRGSRAARSPVRPSSKRTSPARAAMPDGGGVQASRTRTSSPPSPAMRTPMGDDPFAGRGSDAAHGRRPGVVDVQARRLPEQARHPALVRAEPGEEPGVEPDLAVSLEQDHREVAAHAAHLAAPLLGRPRSPAAPCRARRRGRCRQRPSRAPASASPPMRASPRR